MKYLKQRKFIALGSALFLGFQLAADIEEDRTNSIGSGDWQTGLITPSDSDADTACNVIAGLPFSCTLPSSGGGSVTCSPVSIPGGLTLSSGCVLAGSSSSDFSVDVQFDDGVSDPVTKTINLTAGPNQSPTASDPSGCPAAKTGVAWSCNLAGSVTDPEAQPMTFTIGSGAPSWASISGTTLSGTPTASGTVGLAYDINDGVNKGRLELNDVPLNTWFSISIVVNNSSVSLFKNCKLEKILSLKELLSSTSEYNLYIANDGKNVVYNDKERNGFSGQMAYFKYYNFTINQNIITDYCKKYKLKLDKYQNNENKDIKYTTSCLITDSDKKNL